MNQHNWNYFLGFWHIARMVTEYICSMDDRDWFTGAHGPICSSYYTATSNDKHTFSTLSGHVQAGLPGDAVGDNMMELT